MFTFCECGQILLFVYVIVCWQAHYFTKQCEQERKMIYVRSDHVVFFASLIRPAVKPLHSLRTWGGGGVEGWGGWRLDSYDWHLWTRGLGKSTDHIKEDQLGHGVTWLLLGAKMKWPHRRPSRNHLTCRSWVKSMHAWTHTHTQKVRHTVYRKYQRLMVKGEPCWEICLSSSQDKYISASLF